ncbi:MAG: hypothetical protein ACT4PG_03005 [Panacagrimonas sp.]
MFQKSWIALALASGVLLSACGGSSGGSSGGGNTPTGPTARSDVSGPLDAVQEPVSSQIIAPLADAAAGTPLEGVIACVDQVVVGDTLDIIDVLAAQADAGATGFNSAATVVQAEVSNLVADLQGLVTALAGGTGCSATTIPAPGGFGTNPLAGTPLEDFGATLLSTLASVQAQLTGAGGTTPSLSTLTGLVDQISAAYQQALAMVPAEATSAPVVGPALTLVGTALTDLDATVTAAASANPTATATAITTTVEHLISGLLIDVLPIGLLEDQAGGADVISGPITDVLDQISAALTGGFTAPGSNLGGNALTSLVDSLLAPLTGAASGGDPTVILTGLLAQVTAALGGAGGGSVPVIGPDALNEAVAQLTSLLTGASANDSPLAGLIDTLTGLLGGLLG